MSKSTISPARRIGAVAAAAAIAATALGVAAPAFAGNSQYCTGAFVCLYDGDNFTTPLGYRSAGYSIMNMSSAADNKLNSWENRTSTNAAWYDDPNGGGACNTMLAFRENAALGIFSRNGASSWKTNGSC